MTRKPPTGAVVAAALLAGALFRFTGVQWDGGQGYHSDEAEIGRVVAAMNLRGSPDPHFYVYNGFPLYLYAGLGRIAAFLTNDSSWAREPGKITLLGRLVSASASTASTYLTYLVGASLLSPGAGALAAVLSACSVGLIQHAHFSVTESLLVFLLLAIVLACARFAASDSLRAWMAAAVATGLAIGTKTSALSFLIVPAATIALSARALGGRRVARLAGAFSGALALTFLAVSPFTLVRSSDFLRQMAFEREVVSGRRVLWYTTQFLGSTPYLDPLKNLGWQLGPIVAFLGAVGVAAWLIQILRKREDARALPFLLFGAVYFAIVGSWFAKFNRYMLPLVPVWILGTSWIVARAGRSGRFRALRAGTAALAVAGSAAWAVAFLSIYVREHTRLTASTWLYGNAVAGDVLILEQADPPLPAALPGRNPRMFETRVIPCIDLDHPGKPAQLAESLASGDYLVLSSGRCSGNASRVRDYYPVMNRYYRHLFDGSLGYQLVKVFESAPRVGRIAIPDAAAEETFRDFDHPVVRIFANRERKPKGAILNLLTPGSSPPAR